MPQRIQPILLTKEEEDEVKAIVNQGRHSARQIKRGQSLLHRHPGKQPQEIAEWLDVEGVK